MGPGRESFCTTRLRAAQIITDGMDTTPQLDWYTSPKNHKPRTVAGLSKDNQTLTLFTVDAAGESQGMNVKEAASFLLDDSAGLWPTGRGVYNAICLDDGGSTTLAMVEPTSGVASVVNAPSAGTPRAVGSNLAVLVGGADRVLLIRNENSPVSLRRGGRLRDAARHTAVLRSTARTAPRTRQTRRSLTRPTGRPSRSLCEACWQLVATSTSSF